MINIAPHGSDVKRLDQLKTADASVAVGASLLVWTPAAGKRIMLAGLYLIIGTAGTATIRRSATNAMFVRMLANTPLVLNFLPNYLTTWLDDETLNILNNQAAAVQITCTAWGWEET